MKRTFLCALVLLGVVCATASGAETLRVAMSNHPWVKGMQAMLPEFEKETGIKVEVENFGDEQLTQKLTVEFTAGGSKVDVFGIRPPNEGKMFHKNGWVEDLRPFFQNDAEYDFADYTPSSIRATSFGDFQASIPFSTEYQVVYYRKDLLAAKGLKPPETFEELEHHAAILTDPVSETYGFIARGQANALVTQFASFLYSFGSDWFDKATNKSLIATPEYIDAIGYYGGMLRRYGPPGVMNMGWAQAMAVFLQGKAAMYADGTGTFPNLLDPTKSAVADKTGIALFPAGPAGRKIYDVVPWGIAMYSGSTQKEAAWKFIRFFTDKERTARLQGEFANPCARVSTYGLPEANRNFPEDLVRAYRDSVPYAVTGNLPEVTAVVEARDIIGAAVVAAIAGEDHAEAARTADKKFQNILDREAAENK